MALLDGFSNSGFATQALGALERSNQFLESDFAASAMGREASLQANKMVYDAKLKAASAGMKSGSGTNWGGLVSGLGNAAAGYLGGKGFGSGGGNGLGSWQAPSSAFGSSNAAANTFTPSSSLFDSKFNSNFLA